MSGHSKWSTIKRAKGAADAKRGQVFTKLTREIALAVREGGPEADMNSRLRLAIQKAKDQNMPLDNIERAIKKASGGDGEGSSLVEAVFEGYGPGGVAFLMETLTDNRNRTLAEIRSLMTRAGGNLGEVGCVSWLFELKGVIVVDLSGGDGDEMALEAIDAGAEDVKVEDGGYLEVQTKPEELSDVRSALEGKGLTVGSSELVMVPQTTVELDESTAMQVLRLVD